MNPATLLLSSSLASHSSSSCSLLNNCGASVPIAIGSYRNYPDAEFVEVEGSHSPSSGKKISLICLLLLSLNFSFAQNDNHDTAYIPFKRIIDLPQPNKNRQWLIGSINAVGYGGSLIVLNNAWYNGYARTSFHTFNDSKEWLQVDKIGHGWTAYNAGKVSAAMWKWAGLSNKKAAWIGALSSTAFLTGVEFLDAHSAKWGWSWSDIGANFIGSGFFVGQEALWNEQRIQYKFSFHKKKL